MNRRRWQNVTGLVAILGIVALLWGRVSPGREMTSLPPAPLLNHPAPDFSLQSLEGETVSLADLRGKPVVLNFWASWCGPCRGEMPELESLHQRLAEAGVVVLGINQGETEITVMSFRQELGISFPALMDPRQGAGRDYAVNSLPTTFFIDREGIIRDIFIGGMTDALLADNLRTIYP